MSRKFSAFHLPIFEYLHSRHNHRNVKLHGFLQAASFWLILNFPYTEMSSVSVFGVGVDQIGSMFAA